MAEKLDDNILSYDQRIIDKREELISRLFSLINLTFSQIGKRGEDYLVLQQIHETKLRISKEDSTWSF